MKNLSSYIDLAAIKEKSGYDQLDRRQKILLFSGLSVLMLFLLYQLLVSPYVDSRTRLLNSLQRRQADLQEIKKFRQEYSLVKKEEGGVKGRLTKRPKNFALFSFVDQQSEKAKVKGKVKYMKPSFSEGDGLFRESLVEMKLQETTLEEFVNFLKLIESEENLVFLRRISIQESGKEQGYLDVIMQIATFVAEADS